MNPIDDNRRYGLFYIKLGILLFWSGWFFVAFLTNVTDFLAVAQIVVLPFRSGNYDALEKVIEIYQTPHFILNILFALDILAQGLSAVLFFIAALCFWRNSVYAWPAINIAFGNSIALWAVFLIMEEIFIAYPYEPTHIRLFAFELVTLLMLHLLPHHQSK